MAEAPGAATHAPPQQPPPVPAAPQSTAERIAFLDAKILELDAVICGLDASNTLHSTGEYAEQLRDLEESRRVRLLAAQKRNHFQSQALLAEYEATLHELTTAQTCMAVQDAFGKRRSMIQVDRFVEDIQRSQSTVSTEALAAAAPTRNWMEEDLQRISSVMSS